MLNNILVQRLAHKLSANPLATLIVLFTNNSNKCSNLLLCRDINYFYFKNIYLKFEDVRKNCANSRRDALSLFYSTS